ncbi:hypothetical protein AT00_17205 [Pseudoalteromonas lipolytica SCSIO 04301]|uniref:glycosyltransferase n=1 Tax=Pseudoalteromonas lipolytica TaxID=570156 RepID=UPI0004457A95|nr:glycosyltransferase [Pseudoalteromonas lipolytica]EWH04890.1 hypothetical protein AT00_17205 [Pseudoalteromonas lipolytica SCSIO 04301]
MHLAFVLEDFSLGGVERVTEQLIIGLKHYHQCSISIICLSKDGDLLSRYQSLGEIALLSGPRDFAGYKKLITQLNPDLVIFTKGGLSRFSFSTPNHIKTVAVQHVPINLPQESKLKNLLRRLAATFLYRNVDKVVCVSEGIKENLIAFNVINAKDAVRIYNPVLDASLQTRAKEAVEYHDYYVCVGRLHYQKGYDFLVKIVLEAKQQCPDIKVVILGDGPDKLSLTHLIEKHQLSDNIILHGTTDNPYKYIEHAKAILLPSRWEGLPTVLVEAAYLNTPIIAFDCRYGPKELTKHGQAGDLISFANTSEFAQQVVKFDKFGSDKPSPDINDFFLASSTAHYYRLFEALL